MNEIALWLPALILSLFCLIYSVAARWSLYFPIPKGLSAKARNPRAVFLAMLGARNRRRAALVVDRNRRFIDGFSDRLRALTGRVRRLGDARLIREEDDPAILAGHVREAGEQLSALAEEIQILFRGAAGQI